MGKTPKVIRKANYQRDDRFSHSHLQTQLLQLVAVAGILQQSLKPLQNALNFLPLVSASVYRCGRLQKDIFFSKNNINTKIKIKILN